MENTWNVYFDGKSVGTCEVEERGLYFRIRCRCARVNRGFCRLVVNGEGQPRDLGLMIPEGDSLHLERSVAAKRFPKGVWRFVIQSSSKEEEADFFAVQEGATFAHLSKLNKAKFAKRNGEVGLIFE